MLECQGAALAAERRSEEDIARMSIPIEQLRRDDLAVEDYVQEDLGFHLAVARASRNDVLVALVHALRGLLLSTISAGFAVDLDLNIRLRAHQDILDAISRRDSLTAEVAMRDHLANLEQSIKAEQFIGE
jgi:GntR family transcriptional repressor for pyruvate dehydrogenase complex